ncbi:hypothetical protein M9H77_03854 [Catharanthus roseus]|uniref:Uncharacterized protein n=1 Tax=Catharanthus roseus TaxID=4058 RepID=A0ACC0CCF2_CATRO|nr:hypothetical protein M9H77_03854 [Catharanthus roseus]
MISAAESPYSSFWMSYMMRFFPGWPNHQNLCDYCFSLFLVFLLAFTAEFCSFYPIMMNQRQNYVKVLLKDSGLYGLRMFMTYLLIVSVITTDFVFFLVAVAGHIIGNFIAKFNHQFHIEQHSMETESFQAVKV